MVTINTTAQTECLIPQPGVIGHLPAPTGSEALDRIVRNVYGDHLGYDIQDEAGRKTSHIAIYPALTAQCVEFPALERLQRLGSSYVSDFVREQYQGAHSTALSDHTISKWLNATNAALPDGCLAPLNLISHYSTHDTLVGKEGGSRLWTIMAFATLDHQVFDHIDAHNSTFFRSRFNKGQWTNSDFSHCNFDGAKLNNLEIKNCCFNSTDLNCAKLHDVTFSHCNLNGLSLQDSTLSHVTFSHCDLSHLSAQQQHDIMQAGVTFSDCTLPPEMELKLRHPAPVAEPSNDSNVIRAAHRFGNDRSPTHQIAVIGVTHNNTIHPSSPDITR